jgi:ubiquinone/menaquinone biosynthesis C-methylase UbiE
MAGMPTRLPALAGLLLLLPLCRVSADSPAPAPAPAPAGRDGKPAYETRAGTPDGIGKFYMGREIAQVMGHQAADWLERPEREQEEQPQKLIHLMDLRPSDVVADIGAGTGYFSFRMAVKVPDGKVLAVDIQPEMLELLKRAAQARDVTNVEPVLGKVDDPQLPEGGVDVALLVDAYHEFDHPLEMMQGIVRGLRPGGRVVLVEYRGEDPDVPIKPLHKMTEAQAKKEMAAVGLKHVQTLEDLPRQHVMIFRKPLEKTGTTAEPPAKP